jgi:PAS domain S-box-containing protein
MTEKLKILMLEDSHTDAAMVQRLLRKQNPGCEFKLTMSRGDFTLALDEFVPTVILADNSLPQFDAAEALEIVRARSVYIPFILVTGTVSEEFAAGIIKAGADDYVLKDRLPRLPVAIDAAIKKNLAVQEKQLALEETERSNERFETLSAVTKDAIWDWNLLTDEVWWNSNFFDLLGYDSELPVPTASEWSKRIHPHDTEKVISRLRKIRESTVDSWEDEFRFQLSGGGYGTLLDRTYILREEGGNPVRAMGALVDTTEQTRLRREMEVLSLIARETGNSVMIFNRHTGQISWVNEGFIRSTGYTLEDVNGKNPWRRLTGMNTEKGTLDFISTQIADNKPFSCDLSVYTRDGEMREQFLSGQPMSEESGRNKQYFIIGTDITERRRMEEERLANKIERQKEITRIMLQSQEMERNALGRELHDNINQILASVNLRLGYFLEEPEGNIDVIADCRDMLLKAIAEARNLSHHMVMPRFSERSLKEELELLIENFSFSKKVEIELSNFNEEELSSYIKETLFRITQEQLSNIAKHAKADKITMRLYSEDSAIKMEIHDNGIGFDNRQKRKGIGITNILNRVESYNGIASITSKPGNGCTLLVSIPLLTQPPE